MASFSGRCSAANNIREDEVSFRMERMGRCDWSVDASNQNKPDASGRVSPVRRLTRSIHTLSKYTQLTHSHLTLQEIGRLGFSCELLSHTRTAHPLTRYTIFFVTCLSRFPFSFLLGSLALTESHGHFRTRDLNSTARQKQKCNRKPAEAKESRV